MQTEIRIYGNPVLRRKAEPVELPDPEIGALVDNMLSLMRLRNGVGLAAPQAGCSRRLFVAEFDLRLDAEQPDGPRLNPEVVMPLICINPVINQRRGRKSDMEGCLSLPDIWAPVSRAYEIALSYQDLSGAPHELTARGFLARVIQHEIDHLDGILFVDRMTAIKKISLAGELKRMRQRTEAKLRAAGHADG